jgi:hypothetical protein
MKSQLLAARATMLELIGVKVRGPAIRPFNSRRAVAAAVVVATIAVLVIKGLNHLY